MKEAFVIHLMLVIHQTLLKSKSIDHKLKINLPTFSISSLYITLMVLLRIRHQQTNFLMETDKRWQLSFRLNKYSKVYLHSVDDITSLDTLPLFENAADSNSVESLISMKQTYTTEDADELTVKQRKCIFQYENHVNYFKENDIYSLTSCMTKCRMDKAQKYCNCIPPFYAPASGKYKPCNVDQFACLVANRTLITNITGCRHCELSCFSTVYETEKFTYR
jgi:acid-sensing ion channel, other